MESRLLLAGQSLTWDGEGIDDHWSNPQNWVGDQAPSPGDDLIFDSAVPGLSTYETTNDIPGIDIHSLTFVNSGSFRIHGSAINFNNETASIINNGGTNIITADIAFSNGGTIEALSGNLDIQGEVQVGINTVSFNVSENVTIQVNGAVQGVGGIEKSGAGELRLFGPNGYSGETSILEGSVFVRPGSSLGAMSGGTTVAPGSSLLLQTDSHEYISLGGTLQGSDSAVLAGGVMLSSSQAEILSTDSFSITGPLDGSFGVNLSTAPSALLKISGSGSYSGPTNVSGQGTVQLKSPGAISPNRLTIEQPSTVEIMADQVTGSIAGDGNLVLMASLTTGLDNSSTTFSGSISGSMSFIDSLIKTGSGTLTLTGNNTWRGATRVNSGTLKINGGMLNSLPDATSVYVASSATLELNSSGGEEKLTVLEGSGQVLLNDFTVLEVGTDGSSSIFDGQITGNGRLRKSGTGTLTLGGHNAYTGNTEIRDGIVQIQGIDVIPDTGIVDIYDAGTLSITASPETIGGLRGFGMGGHVNVNSNDLTINNTGSSGDSYFNGEIRGSGGLIKQGIGRQVLNGMNTYTGLTRILAGTLGLGTSEALSNVTDLVIDGGTLELAGGQETVNSILLNSGRIEGYGSLNTAFGFTARSGQVSGSSLNGMLAGNLGTGLSKESSGTVTLTGTNFTGTTTITEGTLVLDSDPSGGVIVSGGTLAAIGSVSHGVTLNGGILSVGRPGDTSAGLGLGSLSGTSGTLSLDLGVDDVSILGTGVSGVGGSLALANINLAVTLNGAPPSGHHFNVLRNFTSEPPLPEADRFHNLPEGATLLVDGVPLTITYSGGDGNDIELIYAVNSPPTAVSFVNNVSGLNENLDTTNPVRIADIVISDDGLGSNVLSLSGPDADKFIVTGNSLFLKTNTALDYETQASLSATLTVKDPSLPLFAGVSTVLTLNIANINEAPVANDDAFSVDEDFGLDLTVGDLLGNDVDVDSDPNSLTVISVSDASHGIVTLNPDGSIRFVPNANFYGTAGFSYVLSDGELTSFAEVEVTVEAVNDSPEPVLTITPVSVPKGVPVLFDAFDSSDVEGDSLTYTWEFGDGSVYTESAAGAPDGIYDGRTVHSYADEGNYPATLTVSDDNGGSAETSANVIVLPGTSEIIIAGFTVTNVIENGTSVSGDATLPLFGSVHLNGTVSNGHYSLSTTLSDTAFGHFSATTGSLTLADAGLQFTGAFQLPILGSLSLSGSILDVDHYTITSPSFSKTIGGFDFSNVVATVNPSGLSISGTASLPVLGSLSLSGTILDVDHYTITSPSFSKSIGGFDFSNVIATVNPSGLSISGTASLPVLGSLSLSGSILDVDHYTITSPSFSKSIGGFDFSNVIATVNPSGLSISGTANLPVVGSLALSGSILDVDHYSFSAPPIGNVSVGPFSLANTTITVSQLGLTVEGDVDLPLVGTVHVKGAIQDVDHYSLSTPTISDLSLLGFSLTDNIVSLSPAGIQFSGVANIPIISDVIGDITLTGSITDADTFDIKAQLGDISLLDGLVEFNNPELSLTPDALTFTTQTELLKIGTADFTYVLTADGDYSLTADVGMNVAGFQIDGVKLKYGADGLDVDFKMPVPNLPLPSSEGFSFHGKYTPDHWLLAGTYSGPVTVGPVVLTEITVTLTDVSLGVAAKATVANLEAFVNADMSATVYFDGRFEAFIDIHVLQIGSFQLGEALVTFGNTVPETRTDPNPFNHEFTPDRRFILTIDAFLGVSPGPRVEFGGFIDDTGNYEFHGKEDISLGPVHLAKGEFTLNKQDGLTFSAETHLGVADAHVSGTIDKDWNTNVTADLTILDSLHVSIDGYIHSNGDFHFDGHDEFGIAGVTLSETHFILDNTTGFEFFSDWNYGIFEATLHGTINGNGQIHFDGDGSGRIGSFDLGSVHVDADLDLIAEHYSITVGANIHLIGTDFRLNKTLTFDAGNWSPFQLEGQRSLPGPLNALFPGGVQWKVDQTGASFTGQFKSPALAAGFNVSGNVTSDGKLFVTGDASIPVLGVLHVSGSAATDGRFSLSVQVNGSKFGVALGTLTLSNSGARVDASIPVLGSVTLAIGSGKLSVDLPNKFGVSLGSLTITSSGASIDASIPVLGSVTLAIGSGKLSVDLPNKFGVSLGSLTMTSSGASIDASIPVLGSVTLAIGSGKLSVDLPNKFGVSLGSLTMTSSGASIDASIPVLGSVTLEIGSGKLSVDLPNKFGVSLGSLTMTSSGASIDASIPVLGSVTLAIGSGKLSVDLPNKFGVSLGSLTVTSSGASIDASIPVLGSVTLAIGSGKLSVDLPNKFGVSLGSLTMTSSGASIDASIPVLGSVTLAIGSGKLSVDLPNKFGVSLGSLTVTSSGASIDASIPVLGSVTLAIGSGKLSVDLPNKFGVSLGSLTMTSSGASIDASLPIIGEFSLSIGSGSLTASFSRSYVGATLYSLSVSSSGVTATGWAPYIGSINLSFGEYVNNSHPEGFGRFTIDGLNAGVSIFSIQELRLYSYGEFSVKAYSSILGTIWINGPDLNDLYTALSNRIPSPKIDGPRVGGVAGQVGNTISSGAKSLGKRINGTVAGGIVFFDANRNGQLDTYDPESSGGLLSEPWTFTNSTGEFLAEVPEEFDANHNGILDDADGQWAVAGGIFTATGIPIESVSTAPATWTMVTPVTSLVAEVMNRYGQSSQQAATHILRGLGLPAIDLSGFDGLQEVVNGNELGKSVYVAHAFITDTVTQLSAAISASGNLPPGDVTASVIRVMADRFVQSSLPIVFTDTSLAATLLQNVTDSLGVDIPSNVKSLTASIIAATNLELQGTLSLDGVAFINAAERVKLVAQGAATSAIAEAASGNTVPAVVLEQFTGAALADRIADAVLPPAVLVPETLVVEATSPSGASAEFHASANDIAGQQLNVTFDHASGSFFPLGDRSVRASAVDSFGNIGHADFIVRVKDSTEPRITLREIIVEATGADGAFVNLPANPAMDLVDTHPAIIYSLPDGIFPLGTTSLPVTATDFSGNTASETFLVTVVDTTAPRIHATADITVDADTVDGAFVSLPFVNATDDVDPSPQVSLDFESGRFPVGSTVVTATAVDRYGNVSTSTFSVIVRDVTAPSLEVPLPVILEATTSGGALSGQIPIIVTDNADPAPIVTLDDDVLPSGTTLVTATATDASGNSSSVTFSVTVVDTTAPEVLLPSELVVEATGPGGAVVDLAADAVSDLVDPNVVVTYDYASGLFPPGSTVVTATATDASGNSTVVTFTVTVLDTTAPNLPAQPDLIFVADGPDGRFVTLPEIVAFDAVDANPLVTIDAESGMFAIGTTLVTVTARDAAGNFSSTRFSVIVLDPSQTLVPSITEVGENRVEGQLIRFSGTAIDIATLVPTQNVDLAWRVYRNADNALVASASGVDLSEFEFVPDNDGEYRIELTVTDSFGHSSSTETLIVVENEPPQADFHYQRVNGQVMLFADATDVSTADTNTGFVYEWTVTRDGDLIASDSTLAPEFSFTPEGSGVYSVSLSVTDPDGGTTTVERIISVFVPVAQDLSAAIDEDGSFGGTLTATDTDGDSLTYSLVNAPSHGAVVINDDGSFSYVPNSDYFGSDSFTWIASDFHDSSSSATVSITIAAVNDAPVAEDQQVSGTEDHVVSGVLAASDIDSPHLFYSLNSEALNGTVEINSDGTFLYIPNPDFNGSDSFTFQVNDGDHISVGFVQVTIAAVSDTPIAIEEIVFGFEDAEISGHVNGTDADNDLLTYELLQAPIHGTVQLNADGSFHYVPFENYHGEDSFTFNATDGTLVSHPATLFISVSAINDSPVSFNDQFTVDEDSRLSGILNASDIDGDDLNFVLGVRPAHGTVSLGANGTFRYIPFADFYGSDTFSFAARDLETQSGYQTITVTVEPDNDAPKVSRPLSDLTVAEDSSDLIIHLKDSINDIDSENLTFTAQTSTGTPVFATVNGSDLVLHFLPNQSGTTEITVTADDGSLLAIDTFSVTVTPINDAPAATGNLPYVNVIQGAPGRHVNLGSLFSDVDDLVLTYSASSSNTAVAGVTINDLGALLNFSDTTFGTSIITITATDADGLSASLTFSVKVNEIVPPLGVDLSGGTLRITGTSGNDKVSVTLSGTQYLVTTSFSSPATLRFTTGSVQRILIQLQNGDDVATVSGAVTVPVTIDGGSGDDSLAGGSGSDTLLGGEGNDTLRGGRGNDVLDGGLGSDLADGGDGDDQVTGADGDDQLLGGTGNDILTGSAGNDRLDGGTGNDRYLFIADSPLGIETITDSTGVDTISFDHSASGVTLSLAATVSQTVNSFLTLTISAGSVIENAIGGSGNDLLTGNDAANTLTGLAGNDTLNGGAGNDTYAFNASAAAGSDVISDAAGTDLITFDGTSSAVSFSLALYGPQTVNSGLVLTMLPGTTIENLTGGDGDDILMGNAASNLLKGQGGNDTLSGAAGNDTYAFDADVVLGNDVISDTAGTDTLNYAETSLDVNVNLAASGSQLVNPHQSLTILPGTLLENLIGGSGNDVLRGNSAVNAITGGGGNDWLAGANGNDTYFFNCNAVLGSDTIEEVANGGTDTVSFAGTTQRAVTISLASTTPQVVNDRLTLRLTSETSIENLIGTNGADQLTGNSLSNLLVGGSGNDRLDGGSGNDSLSGAAGDDILAGGADNDVYLMDADTALGTDTIIDAEESNDTLDYSATTTTGVTVNLSLTGIQNVASGHSLILACSNIIENIIGGSQNDQLTGNNLANLLIGNAGNDILDGSAGNDIYTFDADINLGHDVISDVSGNDTLNFSQTTASGISLDLNVPEQTLNLRLTLTINAGTVIEVVIGTAKDDIIRGNSAANILLGNAGNDLLEGREGNDVLIGGSGRDTLSGMIGEDLLIAGQTAYDQKLSLLLSLRDTWNGPQSFIERTEMLQDGTAADEVILTGRVTVLTDGKGQNDTLIGGADSDWYFRALDDAITDLLLNSELTSEL